VGEPHPLEADSIERLSMKTYELVALLHPDLEIDVDTPIAKLEKLIEGQGGKVVKRDNWGKKRLAYKVKGQSFGVYIEFELSIDPDHVRELDRSLGLTEELIRHLLVTKPAPVAKPAKKTKSKPMKEPAEASEPEANKEES
jgi:small subunit ribosomal protein S6